MKRIITVLTLLLTAAAPLQASEWMADLDGALAKAKEEHKAVLLDFTGSDWCGWCMRLKREVFDTAEFEAYSKENLICVEVDFPKRKALSPEQQSANRDLALKYAIKGFPTIILLNENGARIGQGGYCPGGPSAFIANLEQNPGFGRHKMPEVTPAPAPKAEPPKPKPEVARALVAPPPQKYGDLALKAISGQLGHRLALVNNQTLAVGETGKVKVHNEHVDVTLQEIRDNSVVILVAGERRELKLRD